MSCFTGACLILGVYLYRHTEDEREKVHDREAWEQLSLQEHGGVETVEVLHCSIMVM